MGKAGSDAAEGKGARQPVFRDLPGLCAESHKRYGVARPDSEGSNGPECQRVSGVDLCRYLPFKGVLGPMQFTTTRFLNVNESARGGRVRRPDPRGKQLPIPKKWP